MQLFQQLLEIETAPLNLEDCRHSSSIITRLRVHAAADRLPAAYHKPLAQAMLGVLRIRFSLLWDAARETLAALLQVKILTSYAAENGSADLIGCRSRTNAQNIQASSNWSCEIPPQSRRPVRSTHDVVIEAFGSSLSKTYWSLKPSFSTALLGDVLRLI